MTNPDGGEGVSHLSPSPPSHNPKDTMSDYQPSPTWVPIGSIQPAYYHGLHEYRRTGDGADIVDLGLSIKKHGIANPLITTSGLELVAGTRRFDAAKQLGLTEVPVIARDNEELLNALLHDYSHPTYPNLVADTNFREKLQNGLLLHRVMYKFLTELKSRRIALNQAEKSGRKYKGPPIPDISSESLLPLLDLTYNHWTKLRFFSMAVGALPPLNPRALFNHNADRANHWLDYAIRTGMLDSAHMSYAKECRPEGYEEPPHKRTHPTEAPPTVSAEAFTRTMRNASAVLTSTLTTLDQLGGVPDKTTFDQLTPLIEEFNTVVRLSTKVRVRLNAAAKTRQHS